MGESIFIKPARTKVCDVHDWPTDGLARRLVTEMRLKHGHGGVDVCLPCIERARSDAGARASIVETAAILNAEQKR